jgi:hypothetical protein
MMGSREGFRARRRRKKAARSEQAAKADAIRAETRERAAAAGGSEKPKRDRSGALRSRAKRNRAQLDELWIWVKGVGMELRRRARKGLAPVRRRLEPVRREAGKLLRLAGAAVISVLRPLGRGVRAVLAPIAPFVSGALFFALRVLAAIPVYILAAGGWTRDRAVATAKAVGRWVDAHVTPARTFAAIAGLAAIALAVSQFVDYRATAIGADQYEGEVQTVAPVPRIDEEPTGEAHFYALLPLAVLALPLIWLALRGRWRLALPVAAIGLIGVIVTLAVDLPQGLDTGRAGDAYEGTEALLIEGFWTQLFASLALLLSGLALGRTARGPGERSRRRPVGTTPAQEPRGRGATAGEGAGA